MIGLNGKKWKSTTTKATQYRLLKKHYSIDDEIVPRVTNCKYLGIILSNNLGLEEQLTQTNRKACIYLHFIMSN